MMSEEGELDSTLFLGDDFIVLSETGEMTVIGKSLNDTSKRKSILDLDTRTPKRQRLETVLEESEDEDETLESRFDGLLSDDEDTIVPKTRDIGLSPIVVAASSSTSFKGSLITSTPIKKCDGCSKVPHFLDKITDYFKQITENQKQTQPEEKKVENDKKVETEKVIEIPDEEDENINNKSVYHTSQQFISENIQCEFKTFKRGLRPIVIDGSNIALGHSQGKHFSVRGLKICIDFFVKRGHKVYAFVPSYRLKRNQSDNQALLMKLVDEQLVFCTSSREIFGKKICSYDDRILVQAAAAMRAIIVTQDNYRDLLAEDPRLGPTIERGLLMPTWVGDMIIFPEDPLGRFGPKLERFLRYP